MRNLLLNIFGSSRNTEKSTFNKNITAFFICLLVSAFCWFLIVLSKNYQERTSFKVEYINLPQNKALINRLPDSIELDVTANGFAFFEERVFSKKKKLQVDCSRLRMNRDSLSFLVTEGITVMMESQLGGEYSVQHIYPDTIFFNFSARSSRIVPVRLNINLGFEKQYQLSDSIHVEPSKVQVFGAKEMIDKIDHITTEYLVLNKLDRTVVKELGFAESDHGLGFSVDSVKVTIPVDRFTEGIIEVPVETEGLREGYSLKLFPDKVKLRYLVGISDLSRVNAGLFRVVVKYDKGAESSTRLKVEVVESPSFVTGVRVDPEKVEYILRKQ